jgi:hypothetical protein
MFMVEEQADQTKNKQQAPSLAYLPTKKMYAVRLFETPKKVYQTARRNIL